MSPIRENLYSKVLLYTVRKATAILFLSVFFSASYGQTFEGGFGLGAVQYRGDLNPNYNILTSRPGANLMARYNFSRGFSLKAQGMFGFLAGSDKLSSNPMNKLRDYRFAATMMDGSVVLEYNFFNFRSYGTIFKSDWTPILFAGWGSSMILKETYFANGSSFSKPSSELPSTDNLIVYGIGLKRKLGSNWNLNANLGARMRVQKNNSDLVDGFGFAKNENGDLVKVDHFPNNSSTPRVVAVPNSKSPDRYFYFNVSLSYVLYGLKCPNPKK